MRNSGIKKNHKIYIFKHQQTESGGGGGANLEDNKTATIDVSAYTGPVAINPTAGKDGMKKTTVNLSNIPSGGATKLYSMFNDELYSGDFIYVTSLTQSGIAIKYTNDGFKLVQAGTVTYDESTQKLLFSDSEYTDVELYHSSSDDVDLFE